MAKIEGLDNLSKKRLNNNRWMAAAITTAMRQAGLAVQRESVILAPINTGGLRQSITVELGQDKPYPLSVIIGPSVKYGRFVEFGRKPGKAPPISAIEPWVRLKLKVARPRSLRVAYLVARSIAKHGVKAKPFMEPGRKKALPAIDAIFARLRQDLAKAWGRKI